MLTGFCRTQIGGILVAFCLPVHAVWTQGVTLPEEMRQALGRNAEQISPITVSWTQQYQSSLSPEETLAKLEMGNLPIDSLFTREPHRLTWQAGNVYSWWKDSEAVTGPDSHAYECSFDGRTLYHGSPDMVIHDGTPQPKLLMQSVRRLAEKRPDAQHIGNDYFNATGLHLPTTARDLQSNNSGSEILMLLDQGARLVSVADAQFEGRSTVRVELLAENPERRIAERTDPAELELELRSGMQSAVLIQSVLQRLQRKRSLPEKRVYTFYLDPEIQYAVRGRQERYEDGTVLLQVTNGDFERIGPRDVWLPRRSTVDYHTWPTVPGVHFKEPVISNVIEVSEFRPDPVPSEQFVLSYKAPGTLIYDERDTVPGGSLTHQIPADHLTLDAALERIEVVEDSTKVPPIQTSRTEEGWEKLPPIIRIPVARQSRKGRNWALITLNLFVLAGLGAWAAWKRRGRSADDA